MKITIDQVKSITSARKSNSGSVTVECHMTEEQMFDALCEFCGRVTDATFEEWITKVRKS